MIQQNCKTDLFVCHDCGCTDYAYYEDTKCCADCGLLSENYAIYIDDYTNNESNIKMIETKSSLIQNYLNIHYSKHKNFKKALQLTLLYCNNFKTGKQDNYIELIEKTMKYLDGCPRLEKDKVMKKLLSLDSNTIFSSDDVTDDKVRQSCEEIIIQYLSHLNLNEEYKKELIEIVVHDYKNYNKIDKCPTNTPTCILASLIHYLWKTLRQVNVKAVYLGKYFNISEGNISNIKKKFIQIKCDTGYEFGKFSELKQQKKSLLKMMIELNNNEQRQEVVQQLIKERNNNINITS